MHGIIEKQKTKVSNVTVENTLPQGAPHDSYDELQAKKKREEDIANGEVAGQKHSYANSNKNMIRTNDPSDSDSSEPENDELNNDNNNTNNNQVNNNDFNGGQTYTNNNGTIPNIGGNGMYGKMKGQTQTQIAGQGYEVKEQFYPQYGYNHIDPNKYKNKNNKNKPVVRQQPQPQLQQLQQLQQNNMNHYYHQQPQLQHSIIRNSKPAAKITNNISNNINMDNGSWYCQNNSEGNNFTFLKYSSETQFILNNRFNNFQKSNGLKQYQSGEIPIYTNEYNGIVRRNAIVTFDKDSWNKQLNEITGWQYIYIGNEKKELKQFIIKAQSDINGILFNKYRVIYEASTTPQINSQKPMMIHKPEGASHSQSTYALDSASVANTNYSSNNINSNINSNRNDIDNYMRDDEKLLLSQKLKQFALRGHCCNIFIQNGYSIARLNKMTLQQLKYIENTIVKKPIKRGRYKRFIRDITKYKSYE